MNTVKLDSFLNDLANCNSVILPVAEKVMERANKEYGVKKEAAAFELKDYTQVDADVQPKREAVVTINTIAKDRDEEAVLPEGAILDDYELLKVVLYGHNYAGLGVGRNLWLKVDPHLFSIIGRTKYTTALANPLGEQIYNYRLEEMPIGESIGFVPIEHVEPQDKAWGKHFDQWLDRYKQFMKLHQREVPDDLELARIWTKWILLEYSDVIIPSNPFCIQNAVEKGLLAERDMDKYIIKTQPHAQVPDPVTKPETPGDYHHVPVPGRECQITATITISTGQGIKARYCGKEKKVATYLFDKEKWTMAEAKKWVAEHDSGKGLERIYIMLGEDHEQKDTGYTEYWGDMVKTDGLIVFADAEADMDIDTKGAIPYKDLGKADESASWNGPGEVAAAEVSDLKLMCAWFKSDEADTKGAYKLPHHKASGHAAVWRGVAAAMGAVLGARGGVKIPPGDRKSVYSHLSKHYKHWDKEPPEFKLYSEAAMKCIDWYNGTYDDVDGFYIIEDDTELESWYDTIKAFETMKKETDIAALQEQITAMQGQMAEMQGQLNEAMARLTPAELPDEEEAAEEEEIDIAALVDEVFAGDAEDIDDVDDTIPRVLTAEEIVAKRQGKVIQ